MELEKITKKPTQTKIAKIETRRDDKLRWVCTYLDSLPFDPSGDDFEESSIKLPDGRWLCQLKLPLINKTVKTIGKTETNALYGTARKAAKLIDEYIAEHPEINIRNDCKGVPVMYELSEDGRIVCSQPSKSYCASTTKKYMSQYIRSNALIKTTNEKISKIFSSPKNLITISVNHSFIDDKMLPMLNRVVCLTVRGLFNFLNSSLSLNCDPDIIPLNDPLMLRDKPDNTTVVCLLKQPKNNKR